MRLQIKRLITQTAFLFSANLGAFKIKTGFCYPFFYCHGCPAASAGCPLGIIEHAVYKGKIGLNLLLYPLLFLGSVSMIFGRAVCGWICPIGFLQRITYPLSQKKAARKITRRITPTILPYARYIKYINLVLFVFLTTYFIGFMFTDICPIGFLTGTIPISILNFGQFIPNQFFPVALVVFILFVFLIISSGRGWCKYFCPLGALLAPFNKISLLQVYVDKEKCIHCNVCSKVCPMGIDVPNMERSTECIMCGKCIDVCPQKIIKYRVGS
ncbi:MAG TPA: 4Fe-4S binding protein [Thermoplasmatales archaeon]|nr:4Fe-4S binding protein [Thermoplasmatales archaeon]